MPQPNQDFLARRFQSSEFDTELLPDVRSELTTPKRPRILDRPRRSSATSRWPLYVLLLAALLTIAGLVAEQRHGGGIAQDTAQDRERKLAQPTPTPQSTVVPSHTPDLVRNWQEWVFALGATHADTPEHAKRLGEHFRVRPGLF